MKKILMIALSFVCMTLQARENVFSGWFDIRTGSPAGTEVTGRIHLERNKEVHHAPIPATWHFEWAEQTDAPFRLETVRDLSGRLMGVITATEKLPRSLQTISVPAVLKDGDRVLETFTCDIHLVKETLLETFYRRYFPATLEEGRLYGSKKLSDGAAEKLIQELEAGDGRFKGMRCYTTDPVTYKQETKKSLANEWVEVATRIGRLGYVYSTSKVYGPEGEPAQHERLKQVLYRALQEYTDCMPVYGDDVLIDGKPIGDKVGDGFSLLTSHDLLSHGDGTHHWRFTDPMIVPCLALVPDILDGVSKGEEKSLRLHDSLIRYFQIFTSIVEVRRVIDDPTERWGALVDTTYSSGAWADANLGHRSRTMLALPLIWGDYNRPMTYVPYWYEDYYGGQPFEGFSFSTGWSPHGVLFDVNRWMTKYGIPSHHYVQSGFHPDGTISHHVGHGTDAAMVAYGFEWLTDCSAGFRYFKDTPFQVDARYYQFQLDRLLNVYPAFFYKGSMDFLIAGRSHLSDMHKFATKTYPAAVRALEEACGETTVLEGLDSLKSLARDIRQDKYERSLTQAYWVNEYLLHRRANDDVHGPFFASVKLKSQRTVGIEDFSKVRHSWHGGSGILNVKVDGDEYDYKVLYNMDWHALPGLTEEWRTDPLPAEGGSQAALPGLNRVAGVLDDGRNGLAIYHHLPQETYSSATALKSYHFIEDCIAATGSDIQRYRDGQGEDICTFIDQSRFDGPLTIGPTKETRGKVRIIGTDESVDLRLEVEKPLWLHHGRKGYVIVPSRKTQVIVRTGTAVNITDKELADDVPNYIIALDHGAHPGENPEAVGARAKRSDTIYPDNSYTYIIVPDVEAAEMPARTKALLGEIHAQVADSVHTFWHGGEKVRQWAFFKAGKAECKGITVESDAPAMFMLEELPESWVLSVGNPAPDGKLQKLTFKVSEKLRPGIHPYRTKGVEQLDGEHVIVSACPSGAEIVVELPDARDESRYKTRAELYAASPIVVEIPKF